MCVVKFFVILINGLGTGSINCCLSIYAADTNVRLTIPLILQLLHVP